MATKKASKSKKAAVKKAAVKKPAVRKPAVKQDPGTETLQAWERGISVEAALDESDPA